MATDLIGKRTLQNLTIICETRSELLCETTKKVFSILLYIYQLKYT